jgi:Cu(I)/Ag(I) efflux system membrane fusion protein
MEVTTMTRMMFIIALTASLAAGSFAGGTWWAHRPGAAHASANATAVYICPMHPDYHSDHPANCPICGMPLTAHGTSGATGGDAVTRAMAHGTAQVRFERQQAIGVRVGVVSRVAGTRLLRTTGRVEADENRTYPIVAAVSGWIRNVENVTTGDVVQKDQALASFFAPDAQLESAEQAYYDGLEMLYRGAGQPQVPSHGSRTPVEEVERLADAVRSLGVSNSQLRQLAKRREMEHDIRVASPVDGVVLKRSVSSGLRFDRGFEFYRIADLSRVWILADVYRDQLPFIRRGASARITTNEVNHPLSVTVSATEPIFDETTLTLKVRLEAPNPRLALKPGMFVDVEFPLDRPSALVVPADAIVDSGLRKTVFVDRGNGEFEPRPVETGWRIGDDVEVTKGLDAGERIVISGTFFVDSESRMKAQP